MKRVFLAGTTRKTTWRKELGERLIARGVKPEQIIDPHLPKGVKWTKAHIAQERKHKDDPNTIILIVICPGIDEDPSRAELIGPTSIHEIGKYAYSQPRRTAIVLLTELFRPGGRSRHALESLADEHRADFKGKQPYFPSIEAAEDWLVKELVGK